MWAGLLVTELRHSDDLRIWEDESWAGLWEEMFTLQTPLTSSLSLIGKQRILLNNQQHYYLHHRYLLKFTWPSFKSCFLVTAFIKEWMVVDVVDVDQFPSADDVADNAGSERKSHLILLKIQNCGVKRERGMLLLCSVSSGGDIQ